MLYGLFSLQTNLCISLHDQSDILWHNGTNCKQLLFSSDIWAGTSAMGICAFFYMWHWFGVVVFKRCMVDWGDVCHGYMCILLYVTLIWCSGVPEMYGWLMGGQWHSKNKREREGASALDMCIFLSELDMSVFQHGPSALDMTIFRHRLFSVVVIQRSMVNEWGDLFAIGICAFFDMSKWWSVVVLQRSMVDWGVCLPWVYVHSLFLHRTLGVSVFSTLVILQLIWWSGVPEIYGWLRGGTLPWVDVHSALYEMYLV